MEQKSNTDRNIVMRSILVEKSKGEKLEIKIRGERQDRRKDVMPILHKEKYHQRLISPQLINI